MLRKLLVSFLLVAAMPGWAQFEAQPGFTLVALDGAIAHGARIRIEDVQARFGTRENPAPWLFDSVDRVVLGGVASAPYAALADGSVVPETIWQWRSSEIANQGTHVDNPVRVMSSRPTRHAFAQRQYSGIAPSDSAPMNKTVLAFPRYPSNRPRERALYLSYWLRYRHGIAHPNGGAVSGKQLRMGEASNSLGWAGSAASITSQGIVADNLNDYSGWYGGDQFAEVLPAQTWVHLEAWADLDGRAFYVIRNSRLVDTRYSMINGGAPFEFAPNEQWRYYTAPDNGADLRWTPIGYDDPAVSPDIYMLGWDENGTGNTNGQQVDMTDIYVDTEIRHPEIDNGPAQWSNGPAQPGFLTEIQGEILSWSPSLIEFRLFQGAHASLDGRWLRVRTSLNEALTLGRFVSGDSIFSDGFEIP